MFTVQGKNLGTDTEEIRDLEQFLSDAKNIFEKRFGSPNTDSKVSIEHFDLIACIGVGTYSWLMLTQYKKNRTSFSMKVIDKEKVVQLNAVKYILNEKRILQSLNFPFCTSSEYAFKDRSYVYICMPYVPGGELFTYLRDANKFNENKSMFYAAQMVLALEYLHFIGLAYRDLKPENILVDEAGFLKLADFGFSKMVKGRTYTFCGTPEYLAPEIILSKGYGKSVDWWALGVLIFEMAAGYPPFSGQEVMKLYEKITKGKFLMPSDFSYELSSILSQLIEVNITKRIGNLKGGAEDVKNHAWFQHIKWLNILNRTVPAPQLPTIVDPIDHSNYSQFPAPNFAASNENKNDPYWHHFEDF